MSRKLLLFGGISAVSIATITPTGIHFQKEAQKRKVEKAKIEREIFINQASDKANKLEELIKRIDAKSSDDDNKLFFLRDTNDSDEWKLMWIYDVLTYPTGFPKRQSFSYTKEEMNQEQRNYWEKIIKREGKWEKATKEGLDRANKKSKEYWEKFKELCLIFLSSDLIDENKNTNPLFPGSLLCIWSNQSLKEPLENYKQLSNSEKGIMEYFWTVYLKGKRSSSSPSK